MPLFDLPPWPHQEQGVNDALELLNDNVESFAIGSPTGAGKTQMMIALIRWAAANGKRVSLYTNRNLLLQQTIDVLHKHNILHGVRAAQFEELEAIDCPVQISSIATEANRVYKSCRWDLHDADLVLMDEAHLQKAATAQKIIGDHVAQGAQVVGFTATPMGINHVYEKLVVAGTPTSLRECKALVLAQMFSPSEPDLSKVNVQATGEYSYRDIMKHIWTQQIMGHVFEGWKLYNPEQRPALLFAPGVPESLWFAKQFEEQGVNAAHIDGNDVYVDGEQFPSNPKLRAHVIERFRDGDIKVVCNRFVMREGLDFPWLHHLILATPIGSLLSYIQTVGRVLRYSPETPEYVIIQDHGGNYWRHGSPNIDRPWDDYFLLPVSQVVNTRIDSIREQKIPEPIVCPKCQAVRNAGRKCWHCGYETDLRMRRVLQANGMLMEVKGNILKPRRVMMKHSTQKHWDRIYYASRNSKSSRAMTFRQAEALFFLTYHYYPPHNLCNMPKVDADWYRKINLVEQTSLLTPYEAKRLQDETYQPEIELPF